MSRNTPSTGSSIFDVLLQVENLECILSPTAQPSHQTTVEPSADNAATMDARKAAFKVPESQHQAAGSVKQPDNIDSSRSLNGEHATPLELFNEEVEHQLAGHLQDSIATAVRETFMGAKQLTPDAKVSPKKSTLNGLIDVSITRMIESGHLDTYLGTQLSSLADLIMFTDSISR